MSLLNEDSVVDETVDEGIEQPDQGAEQPEGTLKPTDDATPTEHPEWFKSDKYSTIEDQAKAYTELESKFGSFVGAPEKYELGVNEELAALVAEKGLSFLSEDDPFLSGMQETAKELGMSNDGFNKFAEKFITHQVQQEDRRVASELEALGEGGKKTISRINSWSKANLDEAGMTMLQGACTTASGVKFVEYMLNQLQGEPSLTTQGDSGSALSREEIVSMQANPLYKTDAAYRTKVSEAWVEYNKYK